MIPRESKSLLDARTTQDHRLALKWTREMISRSRDFFLHCNQWGNRVCMQSVAQAGSARPWRDGTGPHNRLPPPTRSAYHMSATTRRETGAAAIITGSRPEKLRSNRTRWAVRRRPGGRLRAEFEGWRRLHTFGAAPSGSPGPLEVPAR